MAKITVNGEPITDDMIQYEVERLIRFHAEHGMSQEQIRDGIIDYLTNVLNAEIGYASNTLVIAYTEETTRYCTHVTYTLKFVLSGNEYRYATYYAIPLKDVNEACKNDIHKRIAFYNKKLKYIFLFQDSKAP